MSSRAGEGTLEDTIPIIGGEKPLLARSTYHMLSEDYNCGMCRELAGEVG